MLHQTDSACSPSSDAAPPPVTWWQRAVFYQIYPLSFQDSNADGKGDLGELHLVRSGPERRAAQQLAQSLQ
jgi:hypothetical protein